MKRIAVSLLVAVGIAGCANTFFPLAPDQLFETQLRSNCSFAFNCCEAIERSALGLSSTPDEATCVEQGLESGGTLSLLGQRAKAAVDAGNAVYDDELAERCMRPVLDAIKTCDPDILRTRLDAECLAGFRQAFVTGTIKEGKDCTDSLECADEGDCVVDAAERALTIAGTCEARAGEGDSCSERECLSSLSCDFSLENPECVKVVLLANGERCTADSQCSSNTCLEINNDRCFDSGEPCEDDDGCESNDFCDFESADVCGDADATKTSEICNGRE